ncbi:MAG: disulfide bond formation protein B [Betaproteobacteria bacterium HGW-Betaproteobacteria-7]|jgi:disulfide bond formation protein DsbB|nr:MAG: disulfide bond formation protein B [Betaproteobacteria bacterium HGW-Betaproteobacteria-7]
MNLARIPVRAWFAMLALGCFGLVAFGMALQEMLRLSPCPLCIFQRLLYLLVGVLAVAGFILPMARRLWVGVIGLLALLGASVAAYQSWMQFFPDPANECSFTDPNLIERIVDWLGMQMPSLFLATGFCSSKEWVFLGLSMANWSVAIFLGIAAYVALLARRRA